MGLLVKDVVEDDGEEIISSSYLPKPFPDRQDAAAHIAEIQSLYDVSGYDAKHDRWWARKADEPKRLYYWWIEFPQSPD